MGKDDFRWEIEKVSKMSIDEIEAKMKALVPGFNLEEFAGKTEQYISCEDLSEEEYYPWADFSEIDEDFIWMACEVLWQRLVPDRPAVEHIANLIDDNVEKMAEADEKGKVRRIVTLSTETFELIYRHIIEKTSNGYRLKNEFYEQLQESTLLDIDAFIFAHLMLLQLQGKNKKVLELGDILSQVFDDDNFLEIKAQALFALRRREEGEDCYKQIISRNADDIWFCVNAGDCFLMYGKKDFEKAKDYYAQALDAARKLPDSPEAREDLYLVYDRVIDLAREMGEIDRADRMQGTLDSLRKLSEETKLPARGKIGRNDPCPCGSGKKYKNCCGKNTPHPQQAALFDRRLMERDLSAISQAIEGQNFGSIDEMNQYINDKFNDGTMQDWAAETPLEKAQAVVYQALETSGKAKRLKLAQQALEICPDCADAYVLLAEERARSVEEAFKLYEAGVRAGERALGKKMFQKEAGYFWGVITTRPYMRARAGLAQCLWQMGKREEAVGHYRDMLRLNPNDNQGIRYLLAGCLLEMGELGALEELLGTYDEPTAAWLYTRALLVFLQRGDTPDSRYHLMEAMEYNHLVPAYLLGEKNLPKTIPDRVGFGDKSEAVAYVADFGTGWFKNGEAIKWLRSVSRNEKAIRQDLYGAGYVPSAFVRAFETENTGNARPDDQTEEEIYTFKICLKESPDVWRMIEMRGDQTLHHLHKAIFKAYERYDEHLYAFFLSNKPWDASSEFSTPSPESNAKNSKRAKIKSLDLQPKKKFLYLFDFGDEWWHSIQLLNIRKEEPKGKYPRIVESQGESPSQYDIE